MTDDLERFPYLADPAFLEPHAGPTIRDHYGNACGRDPSPKQIAAMTAAIRATWSEQRELTALGVTQASDRFHRHKPSEASHVPHGISSESIGAQRCRDMML